MRPAAPLLLLLVASALAANDTSPGTNVFLIEDFPNATVSDAGNDTLVDIDGDHEPVVRKKRTFGDVVFRGLADVLGYNVARKPPLFPPPLAPVPGIDVPLQAAPAPSAAPAVAPPPCGAPRAAAPPPCAPRAAAKPKPRPTTPPPCPKPRAAPRPKPRPPPPPPPPPPCAQPRANPATPAPCAPAPPPPPPPPPPKADNLETISSNFQLNFNFNRNQATPAPAADDQADFEQQQEEEEAPVAPIAPIAIEPRAARLPPAQARKPRVYVDAFLLRDGIAQRVDTVDAKRLNNQLASEDDYLAYDDNNDQLQYDDYEDAQESRDRAKAVREFGVAVNQFWDHKKQQKPKAKLPANHYKNVHFGDRDLAELVEPRRRTTHQNLQRERPRPNRIPLPLPEEEEEAEPTTTTEDPRKPLKPRVLPPTEHNPSQIDTVTIRVPPIYKEKRPKKIHRNRPDRDEEEEEQTSDFSSAQDEADTEGDDSWLAPQTEKPVKRRRRRKQNRKSRSTKSEAYSAGDYDYYGNKLAVSEEEKFYQGLTVPTPTKDADIARHEEPDDKHFLSDHERIREDPERVADDDDGERSDEDSGRADEAERSEEDKERSNVDKERSNVDKERASEQERTDKLSPNARVHESGYQNNYVRATNVQVEDPRPAVATVKAVKTQVKTRAA